MFSIPMILLAAADVGGVRADYTLSIRDPAEERARVELRLTGLTAPLELSLPSGTTYVSLEEPRLAGPVRLLDSSRGSCELERLSGYVWRLDPGTADTAELEWIVPLDHRRLPEVANIDTYEFPYLAPDHGLLSAFTLFLAAPELDSLRVRFDLPEGWSVLTPWPRADEGSFAPPDVRSLQDDLIAIGAWQQESRRLGDLELTIAFAPGQAELRAAAPELIEEIVGAELELFGCTPNPKYLFLFGRPDMAGYGGSPKTASMTLMVDASFPTRVALDGLAHLIAHEFHHTWGRARCHLPDELRFVGEGFTDYYAWIVPWRTGYFGAGRARSELEHDLAQAELTRAGLGLSLVEAGGPAFFEPGPTGTALVQGGKVLALLCDLRIRASPGAHTLDDLMRAFYEDPRWRGGHGPTFADMRARVRELTDEEFARRFDAWAHAQEPPDLVAELAALGVTIERRVGPMPADVGALLEGTTFTAIDPSASAALVGVRVGDRVMEINGTAVTDEAELQAAWRPSSTDRIDLWLERGGEELHIERPWPEQLQFHLPEDVLERLR